MSKNYTVGSMFAGIGGICLAFKQVGFHILAAMGSRFERIPFFYDDFSVRLITPREAARLQGFPESYILPTENEKQVYKQIGNSVTVLVVFKIAHNIMCALPNNDIESVNTNEQV